MYKKINLFFILFIILCISFIGSAEQEIYKPIITNDNLLSAAVFSTGNIKTMDAELIDGRLHVSDSVHGVKNLRVLESMLFNRLKGYNGKEVLLYHVNDAGIKDNSRLVPIQSDGTWTYFYDVEFSEVIINGFVGSYEVIAYNLSVSDSLNFGQTFNTSNVTSLIVNISDDATKSDPYDINTSELVSWWKFDDDYLDSSVNGYNGTAHGNTHFVNGKYENGSYLDGTGDYINRTILDYRINDASGSISFFINTTTTQTSYLFSTSDESTTLFFIGVSMRDTGKIALFLRENYNDTHIQSTNIVNDGVGHIVHIESTGNNYNIYIDNEKESLNIIAGNNDGDWFDTVPNRDNIIVGGLLRTSLGLLYTGDIDNLMVYNNSLTTLERNSLYYDHLQQLKMKTNDNDTWSREWNSTADNLIQVPYADGEFFSFLNFTVPETVVQNGITIYDYPSTVQFDAVTTVGYTEDITKIIEEATAGTYTLNVTHAANNTGEGYINYTTVNSVLLDADFWNAATLITDNPNASLSTTLPNFNISTGYVAATTEFYYLVEQDYFYPPTNIQTIPSQCCVNITWDAVPNADNYSVYELEDGFPYVITNPVIDGVKDAIYDYAHEFLIFSPNPVTHGDYGTIHPVRTVLGAYLLIESIDNDDKLGDDDTIYYFDLDNDGLTINDPAWKITNNIVKKYLWNGNNWAVTGNTNAVGSSAGGGTYYPIHELFIPVAELGSNWTNGSIVKVLVKREDSALSPDVITWYPYGNINNTDTDLWQEMVLNDPNSYTFLNNTTNLWYNATGLTPFTIYHGAVSSWNGSTESDYTLFDVITEDIPFYSVSGYVFDDLGNTIEGAVVYSCNAFVHEITQTDIYGYWIGYNFREGNYTICANKSSYQENFTNIYVSTNMTNINVTLTAYTIIDWEIYQKLLLLESQNDEILLNMSINNTIVNDKIDTILIFILLNMAVIMGIIIGRRGKDNDK